MNLCKIILACIALWFRGVAAQAPPPAKWGPPPVTTLAMMASVIPSSDLERSIAFYTKGLGMTLAGRIENPSGTEAPLQFPGAGAYIILFKTKTAHSEPAHGR